jgi:hypothetical protein
MILGGLGWAPAMITAATTGAAIGAFVGAALVRACRTAWYTAGWNDGFTDGRDAGPLGVGQDRPHDVADVAPLVSAEPLPRLAEAHAEDGVSDHVVVPFHRGSSPRHSVARLSSATAQLVTGKEAANIP